MALYAGLSDVLLSEASYDRILRATLCLPSKEARRKAFNPWLPPLRDPDGLCAGPLLHPDARLGHQVAPHLHILLANLHLLVPPTLTPIAYGVKRPGTECGACRGRGKACPEEAGLGVGGRQHGRSQQGTLPPQPQRSQPWAPAAPPPPQEGLQPDSQGSRGLSATPFPRQFRAAGAWGVEPEGAPDLAGCPSVMEGGDCPSTDAPGREERNRSCAGQRGQRGWAVLLGASLGQACWPVCSQAASDCAGSGLKAATGFLAVAGLLGVKANPQRARQGRPQELSLAPGDGGPLQAPLHGHWRAALDSGGGGSSEHLSLPWPDGEGEALPREGWGGRGGTAGRQTVEPSRRNPNPNPRGPQGLEVESTRRRCPLFSLGNQ